MYMAKILQLHNRYDQDLLQKLWFKLLSSRICLQLEEEVLDTTNG